MTDEKFWKFITMDLGEKHRFIAQKKWDSFTISNFLRKMEEDVVEVCRTNKEKAKACGIQFIDDEPKDIRKQKMNGLSESWKIIDPKTFVRIFKEGKGGKQARTKNIFAVFLGYNSEMDYLSSKGEGEHKNVEQLPNSNKMNTNLKNNEQKNQKFTLSDKLVAILGILLLFVIISKNLLANPIVLSGLVLLLFFGIHRLIIISGIIQPIPENEGSSILKAILKYGFYIALAVILSGVLSSSLGILNTKIVGQTAFDVIKEQALKDFSSMGHLIFSIRRQKPEPYNRKPFIGEHNANYLAEVKRHYQSYLDDLETSLEYSPLTQATFEAHSINLTESDKATKLQAVYEDLSGSRNEFSELVSFSGRFLSASIDNERIAKYIRYRHQEKLTQSQIFFAQAAAKFVLLLEEAPKVSQLAVAAKAAGFTITEKQPKSIWKQLMQQMAEFTYQKSVLHAQENNLPIPDKPVATDSVDPQDLMNEIDNYLDSLYTRDTWEPDSFTFEGMEHLKKREIDRTIYLPGIKRNRASVGRPPDSLTDADYSIISQQALDSLEKDPGKLLTLVVFAFIESDEAAIRYYLQKALESDEPNVIQREYFSRSLELMNQPDLYGESMGIMVMRVLPQSAFKEAGIQEGDIIFKINGKEVLNHFDIPKILAGKGRDNDHLIEFYRDGQYYSKTIRSDLPAGAEVTPLVAWELIRLG